MRRNAAISASLTTGRVWPLIPLGLAVGITLADWRADLWRDPWIWSVLLGANLLFLFTFLKPPQTHFWVFARALIMSALIGAGLYYAEILRAEHTPIKGRYYGSVEGVITDMDRASSGGLRLLLSDVRLEYGPQPDYVRLSLYGPYRQEDIIAGTTVMTTAMLSEPSGPVEPGGFSFAKSAYFDEIAAVGYTRLPLVRAPVKSEPSLSHRLRQFRANITAGLIDRMGEVNGGFAAAIFVGDRSALPVDTVAAMRKSNLAHLLAISGMHVGIITGVVFLTLHLAFLCLPRLGNGSAARRYAAMGAILAALIYLGISGMSVATTRATIMAFIFFLAIMTHRKALSLRSIALAAILILLISPSSLFNVGFQMSFAATTALVTVFSRINPLTWPMPSLLRWICVLAMTSFVAGLATAPFAALAFNTVPKYGLLANILAVPAMSFIVMPMALLAMLLWPLGLSVWPLWLSGAGIGWIIKVGSWVAGFENSVWFVGARAGWWLPFMLITMLIAIVMIERKGLYRPLILASLVSFLSFFVAKASRPDLIIAADSRFFGLNGAEGRRMSRATGHSFEASSWRALDGTNPDIYAALALDGHPAYMPLPNDYRLVFTTHKAGQDVASCAPNEILILAQSENRPAGECLYFNENIMRDTGTVAISLTAGGAEVALSAPSRDYPWASPVSDNIKKEIGLHYLAKE